MGVRSQSSPFNARGLFRCIRYAFMPNKLRFCGPDRNQEIFAYYYHQQIDPGLFSILSGFQVLYPYLNFIAQSNQIRDPFDERVVEAYWIGNHLLENLTKSNLYRHLREEHQLNKKLNKKLWNKLVVKIGFGAKSHHNFHVLNVWKRTGHLDVYHTLNSMDLCRISWGVIKAVKPPYLKISYQPLILEDDKLKLGPEVKQNILYEIDDSGFLENPLPGQWVSVHWGFACEILTKAQVHNLSKYTKESIRLANSN